MMRWFGENWGAPVCDGEHVEVPIEIPCGGCGKRIREESQGVIIPDYYWGYRKGNPWHLECFLHELGIEVL